MITIEIVVKGGIVKIQAGSAIPQGQKKVINAKHEAIARRVLEYQNDIMLHRFAKQKECSFEEAEKLFCECKKFLVVCMLFDGVCSPSPQIDAMWHHFILHTRDYARFCREYLGGFIHHSPTDTPVVENRAAMLTFANHLFGEIEEEIWPKLDITACDSSCGGDDYCSN